MLSDYIGNSGNANIELMQNIVDYYFNVSVDKEIDVEMATMDNVYSTPGFGNEVINSLPKDGVEICED